MILCATCKSRMVVMAPEDIGIPVIHLDYNKQPYMVFFGDKATCRTCQTSVIANFGKGMTRYNDEDFPKLVSSIKNSSAFYLEVE